MFRGSSDGIEEYTTSVTGFINKCIEDIVPTVTVRTYPNQKPWITGNIRTELKKRRTGHAPILIDGAIVEQVESVKFLGVHINNKLSWSKHTKTVVKSRQHLFPSGD